VKRAIIFLIAFATGCAPAYEPRTASTAEPERDLAGYEARLGELQRELDTELPAKAPGEPLTSEHQGSSDQCGVAADLRDRICDLSSRICDIAERDPSAADTMLKCQRAREACSDARSRVAGACD
jgi:hypothetical protein